MPTPSAYAPLTLTGLSVNQMQSAVNTEAPNLSSLADTLTMVFQVVSKASGQTLKEHRLVVMPEAYSATADARANMQYTADGVYYDATGKLGLTRFAIEGLTLFHGQKLPNGRVIDGMAAFRDLLDTWELYLTGNAAFPTITGHDPNDLMFLFVDETWPVTSQQPAPPEWIIHPDGRLPTLERNAKRPFIYAYKMNFVAYKRDIRIESRPTLPTRPSTRSVLRDLQNLVNEMPTIDSLATYILGDVLGDQGIAMVETAQRYQQTIRSVIGLVSDFATGASSLVDSTFERINQVLADGENLRNAVLSLADLMTLGRVTDEHSYILAEIRHVGARMNALRVLPDALGGSASQRYGAYAGRGKGAGFARKRSTSTVSELLGLAEANTSPESFRLKFDALTEVQLNGGDTIESIAGQTGINVEAIVAINNLRFPYIDTSQTRPEGDPFDDFGANVLYLGDTVTLPIAAPTGASGGIQPANEVLLPIDATDLSVPDRLFGSDLRWDAEAKDIVLVDAANDLATVAGLDNLLQSISLGWALRPGQLNHFPSRGSFVYDSVGSYMTGTARARLALNVQKTLTQNPKIAVVTKLTATGKAGYFNVDFNAVALGGARTGDLIVPGLGGL